MIWGESMDKPVQEASKEARILAAAEQVFSRKGYTKATLDEIIKIADTGKGTVYKYYKNKDFLFYTLIIGKHKLLLEEISTQCGADLKFQERLENFFLVVMKFILQNNVLWQVLIFETMASTAGWKLVWNEEQKDFDVDVKWGDSPKAADIAFKKKYAFILKEEIGALEEIFRKGISDGEIKPMRDVPLAATNIFIGNIIMLSQKSSAALDLKNIAQDVGDMFMHGHKK